MTSAREHLSAAAQLADDVLFPAAAGVEAAGVVPIGHLDLLAAEGLYGLAAEPATDRAGMFRIVEILASGCLATTFVWMQHHGVLRAVADSPLRDRFFAGLRSGRVRAGTAQGGLRPGPPLLRVTSAEGGYVLDGEAPWVTGWGLVDVVLVAARSEDDLCHWLLLDAVPAAGLSVEPLELLAVTASRTVHMRFTGYAVPADRLVGTLPFAQWPGRDAAGLRPNGSLALGVATRSARLLAPADAGLAAALTSTVETVRSELDRVGQADLPAARASASALALRCATGLVVATGARSVLAGQTAGRLLREAAFLQVFGSRPAIRAELLRRLA
jgi:alkylation response protein AidB-like acyl-CoA dehydrogenase